MTNFNQAEVAFNGSAVDAYEMSIENQDFRDEEISKMFEEISSDNEMIDSAVLDALADEEFLKSWQTENGNLFRARGACDAKEIMDAAIGVADLMEVAARKMAVRDFEKQFCII